MYFVALFFSIFICSAIFYAVNPKGGMAKNDSQPVEKTAMVQPGSSVLLTVTSK